MVKLSFESPIDLEPGDSVEVEVAADGTEKIWVVRANGAREPVATPKDEPPPFTEEVRGSFLVRPWR